MFSSGSYRKNGPWEVERRGVWHVIEPHSVPEEKKAEYAAYLEQRKTAAAGRLEVERSEANHRAVEAAFLEAEQIEFVRTAWQTASTELGQHVFHVDGRVYDTGEMLLLCAERYGWSGRVTTLYRQLIQCLNDGGRRIHDYAARPGVGTSDSSTHLPASLAGLEEI